MPDVKLGISTYSYWHFRDPKVSVETVIDRASAKFGKGAVRSAGRLARRDSRVDTREPGNTDH